MNGIAIVTRALSYPARLVQWGLVQWYALVMIFGLVGLGAYYFVPPSTWQWMRSHWYLAIVFAILLVVLGWITSRASERSLNTPKLDAQSGD